MQDNCVDHLVVHIRLGPCFSCVRLALVFAAALELNRLDSTFGVLVHCEVVEEIQVVLLLRPEYGKDLEILDWSC